MHQRKQVLEHTGLPRSGKNIWKMKFFPGQGYLERTWKVREKSRNLKIYGYGRQSSENLFILFKRERIYAFS